MSGEWIVAAIALLLGWGVLRDRRIRRKRKAARERKQRYEKEKASRREAHYMRNFWSYDGSCQEEFEE